MNEQTIPIYSRLINEYEKGKTHSGIIQSFETLERTGNIQYVDQILNRQYKVVDKAYFAQDIFYIPWRMIIAYKDVKDISPLSGINEYEIEIVDGTKYRICMLKITLEELLSHIEIPEDPRKTKKKINKFVFLWIIIGSIIVLAFNYLSSCAIGRKCEICDDYIIDDYYYDNSDKETIYYCEPCYKRYK